MLAGRLYLWVGRDEMYAGNAGAALLLISLLLALRELDPLLEADEIEEIEAEAEAEARGVRGLMTPSLGGASPSRS